MLPYERLQAAALELALMAIAIPPDQVPQPMKAAIANVVYTAIDIEDMKNALRERLTQMDKYGIVTA